MAELQELRDKLLESEKLMSEATRSWKEKLMQTEARKREEMEELKVCWWCGVVCVCLCVCVCVCVCVCTAESLV